MKEKEKQNRFMELFEAQYDSLWRFVLNLTRNRETAKELLAETVAAAFAGFEGIKEEKAFLSYLFTIAYRTFQKNKKIAERFLSFEDSIFEFENIACISPEDAADIALLYDYLEQLPEKERVTILLFDIFGFSRKEIAEMHSTTENTVKSRLARGRAKLLSLLNDTMFEKK